MLVLDEPANGLDPQGIRWLRDFLRRLAAEGRAVLVSSHVLAEVAQTADEVVVIHRGRSVAQAPLDELMARSRGGMRVAGPDAGRLGELLRADGATVQPTATARSRRRPQWRADRARDRRERGSSSPSCRRSAQSLEEIFFELTEGAEEGRVTNALSSELLKLRTTRTFLALVLAACCGRPDRRARRGARPFEGVRRRRARTSQLFAGFVELFALVLGILAVTTEFRHGTITPTLLAVPSRTRLDAAKLVAHLLAGFVLGLLADAADVAVVEAILGLRGIETGHDRAGAARWALGFGAATALFAGFGVGLGAIVRNQVGAIVGALAWLFVVEPLLGVIPGFSDVVPKWFPGGASSEVAGDERARRPARPAPGRDRAGRLRGWSSSSPGS